MGPSPGHDSTCASGEQARVPRRHEGQSGSKANVQKPSALWSASQKPAERSERPPPPRRSPPPSTHVIRIGAAKGVRGESTRIVTRTDDAAWRNARERQRARIVTLVALTPNSRSPRATSRL